MHNVRKNKLSRSKNANLNSDVIGISIFHKYHQFSHSHKTNTIPVILQTPIAGKIVKSHFEIPFQNLLLL